MLNLRHRRVTTELTELMKSSTGIWVKKVWPRLLIYNVWTYYFSLSYRNRKGVAKMATRQISFLHKAEWFLWFSALPEMLVFETELLLRQRSPGGEKSCLQWSSWAAAWQMGKELSWAETWNSWANQMTQATMSEFCNGGFWASRTFSCTILAKSSSFLSCFWQKTELRKAEVKVYTVLSSHFIISVSFCLHLVQIIKS